MDKIQKDILKIIEDKNKPRRKPPKKTKQQIFTKSKGKYIKTKCPCGCTACYKSH